MHRFYLSGECPLHQLYRPNTRSNCWKRVSHQRSIRSRLALARLFSANMIKIQPLCSTAIKNECQVSAVPRSSDIAMLRKVPHLRVLSQSGFSMGYLAYNMTHPPLDDV